MRPAAMAAGRVTETAYSHESVVIGNWATAFVPLFAAHIQCIEPRIRPCANLPENELHQVASALAGFGHMVVKSQVSRAS